jgi:threonine dehydrogenase-like Zn-dependent dehydrogenase
MIQSFEKMKALRLFQPGDLRLVDEPAPQPAPEEALLRVKAVGLCGSDLHWFNEGGIVAWSNRSSWGTSLPG